MAKSKTTNQVLFDTIRDLKKVSAKLNVKVYRAVAESLSSAASQRSEVNVSKISRNTKNSETVIIAGKVLGSGSIDKKVTVVAFTASEGAVKKIEAAGGKFVSIKEYIAGKPDKKIKILA